MRSISPKSFITTTGNDLPEPRHDHGEVSRVLERCRGGDPAHILLLSSDNRSVFLLYPDDEIKKEKKERKKEKKKERKEERYERKKEWTERQRDRKKKRKKEKTKAFCTLGVLYSSPYPA